VKRVRIHYRRLPDREQIFDQRLVLERDDVIVTLTDPMPLDAPMRIDGAPALEQGSRVVWFTFPGHWHDVGRFHLADGSFTGCYGNVLTPPRILGDAWYTTDLFLDVWMPPQGPPQLLDVDELEEALALSHIDEGLARRAREEANAMLERAARGDWPPTVVREWTLERALAAVPDQARAGSGAVRDERRA
jgi:predicted RNA-binding protein associated with RNAse of E/G family